MKKFFFHFYIVFFEFFMLSFFCFLFLSYCVYVLYVTLLFHGIIMWLYCDSKLNLSIWLKSLRGFIIFYTVIRSNLSVRYSNARSTVVYVRTPYSSGWISDYFFSRKNDYLTRKDWSRKIGVKYLNRLFLNWQIKSFPKVGMIMNFSMEYCWIIK